MKTIPTCAVWDGITDEDDDDDDDRMRPGGDDDDDSGDDEDLWAGMPIAEGENDGQTGQRRGTGRQ
jgi:hypothetical protein